ncbi:MAG: peroxiredoxin [Ignavibacteriales bacterium]|jgi:peroxiredoxin|nr:peroxiredoxin [Ignavibacteriaceae bacterium]NLH61109.1 peroxiredoxin [Ignavibacteriales bacterium]HOJ17586.1 peroxiredoxin [Ignavibacteriaceae bacterium]HPO55934.1 peroxiredoxin [Ignavibacteriaceae bacterium]
MSLKIGDLAPDFSLFNTNVEKVTLSSLRGKNVVLMFFPLADTAVCTKEMCTMRDDYSRYLDLNAEIIGLSVDSPFALKMWKDKHNLNFTLVSDFNKEVIKAYGAMYDVFVPGKFDYAGVAKRSAFVIDKEGKLKYIEILENAGEEPNYENIKAALQA